MIETSSCRRALLLRHFGDDPANGCGNCDNCLAPPSTSMRPRRRASCFRPAFRTEMRFGISHLTEVLAGNDSERVRSFGHHRLSVFGIADADELALMKPVSRALMARDALRADEYGGLSFGPGAKPLLKARRRSNWSCRPNASAGPAAVRSRPRTAIRCSMRFGLVGATWPSRPGCRPTWCSTTARCARSRS
jgi:superfamily II DNA helicase RecQ